MADFGDLLARLTAAVAHTRAEEPMSARLCEAYRELAGFSGAAITLGYGELYRVTLAATDAVSARLEDLQDVVGEGPGHDAWSRARIALGRVPDNEDPARWQAFTEEAAEVVESARIVAVPMRPWTDLFGIVTLYQVPERPSGLRLETAQLQFLANAVGAALAQDASAVDPDVTGPWGSRARVHQATGMVVAQLRITPDDALALLRAHAYAQRSTLADIAASVVERRLNLSVP